MKTKKDKTIELLEDILAELKKANKVEITGQPIPQWMLPPNQSLQFPHHYHNGSPCYNNPCKWC